MKRTILLLIFLDVFISNCELNNFVATNEWQEIQEGQKVPAGLHYRMNLETGKKEAKILEKENDADSKVKVTSPVLSDQNVVEDDEPSDVQYFINMHLYFFQNLF